MIPFTENARKCTVIYHDRKLISGCLGAQQTEGAKRTDYQGVQGTLGSDKYVHCLCHGDSFLSLYTHVKICQIVHFKSEQIIACQLYLIIGVFKNVFIKRFTFLHAYFFWYHSQKKPVSDSVDFKSNNLGVIIFWMHGST